MGHNKTLAHTSYKAVFMGGLSAPEINLKRIHLKTHLKDVVSTGPSLIIDGIVLCTIV